MTAIGYKDPEKENQNTAVLQSYILYTLHIFYNQKLKKPTIETHRFNIEMNQIMFMYMFESLTKTHQT
jgi:hypothetical protein